MKNKFYNKILSLVAVLALLAVSINKVDAQTPGGTALTTEVWLSGDKVNGPGVALPANGASVSTWKSAVTGVGRDYVQNAHSTASYNVVPTFKSTGGTLMNFQPALAFDENATKLVNRDNLLDLTKAYYVFYVSRSSTTGNNRVLFTFSANNATARNNNVGWYGGNPYFALSASNKYHQGNGKQYGVNASIIPNTTTSTPLSYMNGVANTTNFATGTRVLATGTYNMSVIGNRNYDNSYPFTGDIQELIILSAANGSTIAPSDLNRINSYLALKYGITMTVGDYVNSSGTPVWTRASNTGYTNNIIGLAYDAASGLNQKQARSTDNNEVTIFLGDNLANLNVNNTSNALADGDYLVMGSNAGGKQLIPYTYMVGTSFAPGGGIATLDEDINYRRGLVFKAQATRSFTGVNVITDATYVLVSPNDPTFAPANTRLYKVDDAKGYASVDINNGDYIGFAFYEGLPGGLKDGLELWLSADYLHGKSGDMAESDMPITNWTDLSINERNFVEAASGAAVPKYSYSGLNFNPSVNFNIDGEETMVTTDRQKKLVSAAPFPIVNTKSYYTFWVSSVDTDKAGATGNSNPTGSERAIVFTFNGSTSAANNNGWYVTRSSTDVIPQMEVSTASSYQSRPANDSKTATSISTSIRPNVTGTNQTQYFNGSALSTTGAAMTTSTTALAAIGNSVSTATGTTYPYFGDVQEIIVYSGAAGTSIDPEDLKKIHSYLAIKYGISLDGQDLVNSAGTLVWNGVDTKNTGFTKNVFGLGRDNPSGLYVKQSKNSESSEFTAYVGNALADLNVDNTGSIPNGQYIIFGSNGGGDMISYIYDDPAAVTFLEGALEDRVNYRSGTILKVQLTGTTSFDVNLISKGQYLMVSSTPDFIPAQTKIYKLAEDGSISVTLHDGEYISNCFFASGPGGIVNGLRMWLDAGEEEKIKYDETTGDVISWSDKSNISNTVYSYMKMTSGSYVYNQPPGFATAQRVMNYYPSVEFRNRASMGNDNYGDYLSTRNSPGSIMQPKQFTTIHVIFQDFSKAARNYFMAFGWLAPSGGGAPAAGGGNNQGLGKPGFGLNYSSGNIVGRVWSDGGGGSTQGTKNLAKLGSTSININTVDALNRNVRFEANGIYEDRQPSASMANGFKMNAEGTLGGGSLRNASMIGNMAEAIYFEKILDQTDLDKIYSSLAMKYGVTLHFENRAAGPNFDYKLTDGTSIWNGNASVSNYATYYNNIAGLVRDDAAGFFNNISNSTDAQSVVTMMVQGHDMLVGQGDSAKLEVDKSFLFWGNNGVNTLTEFTEEQQRLYCTMVQQKTGRIWMVRKSDNLDILKVTMAIKNDANGSLDNVGADLRLEGFDNIEQAGKRVYLLVADSPEKLQNNQWDMAIPSTYVKYKGQMLNYTFRDEFTYFSLGIEDVAGGGCDNCNFEDVQGITFDRDFQRSTWPNRTTQATFNVGIDRDSLGVSFPFDATIKADFVDKTTGNSVTTARFYASTPRLYQNTNKGNILYLNRYRSTAPIMRTTIETTSAASAKFQIRGINRYGQRYQTVTVSGFCEGETEASVFPTIKGVNPTAALRTFTISGNRIITRYNPSTNSRYDSRDRNVVNVTFNSAVKKIQIDQELTGRATTGSNWLGIGDITYYCPAPLPEYNEMGLAMNMEVIPKDVIMCGGVNPVRYSVNFYNSNCDEKAVTVRDTLPANMYWDINEIKIDEIAIGEKTKIEIFDKDVVGDKRILKIDSLYVPGTPETSIPALTISLGALFASGAPEGIYENQAWFEGKIYKNGVYVDTEPYPSDDFILGAGRKTPVNAIDGGMDLQPVTVAAEDAGCYAADRVVPLSFKVTNPNSVLVDKLIIEVFHSEEFTYVNNTLKINGVSVNPVFEQDVDTGGNIPGYFYITYNEYSALALAANGELNVTFSVSAPNKDGLVKAVDENGNYVDWEGNTSATPFPDAQQAYYDMELDFSLSTDMDDVCINASLNNAYSNVTAPYCRSKEYIISNKNATQRIKK